MRLAPDKAYIQDTLAAALTADRQSDAALAAYEKVMRMDLEYVREYQTFLKKRGHYAGAVDGDYGPGTRAALRAQIATGCALLDNDCR